MLWQEKQAERILVMSPVRLGQYTVSAALAFILSTPWWAACRRLNIAGRRVVGTMILSPSMATPSSS